MIRFISGLIVNIRENLVVIDVAGVGLEVTCSREALSLCRVGDKVTLPVYLHISESGPLLFGFGDYSERECFLMLKNVKGMGARTAISILRWLSAPELLKIIQDQNPERLERVPGIGHKTAERICFELKDKVKKVFAGETDLPEANDKLQVIRLALKELNFSDGDINKAIGILEKSQDIACQSEEKLLQQALRALIG